MQQEPTSVRELPSKNQYVRRGLLYGLAGVALLFLAFYLNSLDTSMFTDPANQQALTAFGCLSGLAFVVGIILLFIPVLLWRTYRRQLAASSSRGAQPGPPLPAKGTAPEKGESAAFLGDIVGVLGWIIGGKRFNRVMALAGFVTFVGFFTLSRGLMNLNLTFIGVGLVMAGFGLGLRIIVGVL